MSWTLLSLRPEYRQQSAYIEMLPLMYNSTVFNDQLGEEQLKAFGDKRVATGAKLTGSFDAKALPLSADLLRWYLTHGFEVTAVHALIHYKRGTTFRKFVDDFAAKRKAVGKDSVLGECIKLTMNSIYGKDLMDKRLHTTTSYTLDQKTYEKAQRSHNL